MQSRQHTGRRYFSIPAALTVLSLTSAATLASGQVQERERDEPKEPAKTATATVNTQNVAKAVADLRKAVLSEFEKTPLLQGKALDSSKLSIHACDQGTVIAGAPVTGSTGLAGGITDPNRPDASRPTDPNRPTDATRPAPASAGRDDGRVVGALFLVGRFSTKMDARGQTMEGSGAQDLTGGTYLVKRAATGQAVQIVDANERVIATVPLIGTQPFPTREFGDPKDLGDPTKNDPTKDSSKNDPRATDPARTEMGQVTGTNDWDKIYMSILHHFQPKFG